MELSDLNEKADQLVQKLELDPERSADGLVKLVLSLLNTIRELMEKQSLRKIENEELSEEQIEKIGATFLALEQKMEDLKEHFHFTDDDLDIDLNKFLKAE